MGVSRLQPAGGANDFTLDIGSSGNTTFTLTKEYAPGAYSITSQLADASLDIYLINADGSSAGYTNSKSLTATKGFNKIVVYGASTNDLLLFEYKTTFSPTGAGNVDSGAAPFATSVSPSDLPDIDDTTTITGGNFATDVEVTFTGTNAVALDAKNIVRASSTSLLVTRPDALIQDHSPYDVTISNPGITSPSVNVNFLNNAITAGGDPTWVTSAGALTAAIRDVAYSVTLSATDPDGGAITYSLVSGSLPTGLSLDSSTGVISGTPTTIESQNFTIAATDTGGNITNRSFSLEVGYSASGGTITESGGYVYHTFASSGTFTPAVSLTVEALIVAGGGGGGSDVSGGGGAGGLVYYQNTLSAGSYTVTVGAGGAGSNNRSSGASAAQNGQNSAFTGATTAVGGGAGGNYTLAGVSGGSGGGGGGGANTSGGAGTSGQGNAGSGGTTANYAAGGGGGAGGAGVTPVSTTGGYGGIGLQFSAFATATNTGQSGYYAGGGGGGGTTGGNGGLGGGGRGHNRDNSVLAQSGTVNTGGGGGGTGGWSVDGPAAGNGGSGIVIVRYPI